MALNSAITDRLRRRQQDMFRFAANKGITQKAMAHGSGLSLTSLSDYANGKTSMSGEAILALQPIIGAEAISMLFDDNLQLVDAPEEMDHEAVDQACRDYSDTKAEFHREDSECGPAIGPTEDRVLREKGVKLAVAT